MFSGKGICIISEYSDSVGLVGQPASEIDLIWTSTISPFLIGMSNWFEFTVFASVTISSAHW